MSSLEHMRIQSPLAQRFLTDEPGVGGRLKVHPEDFIVEELPLYEPCGEGQHLYLRVEKIGVSHGELMSHLRRTFGVENVAVGYAGMKDKHAVTRQTISIDLPQDPPELRIEHDRIKILWARRHRNKIKRGHLEGNRFALRIRDVEPTRVTQVQRTIRRLERDGVPCYFGSQRFGYRCNNHLLGAMLLEEDWDGMVAELLGAQGSPFPEYQRERRELFDQGRYRDAAALWGPADRAELVAVKKLRFRGRPRDAMFAVGNITLNFWASSLMSAAFNRVLDRRIDNGTVGELLEGDLAWKHDSRAVFPVTASELASGRLQSRLEALEISPSGPLWGEGIREARGAIAQIDRESLDATGIPYDTLMRSPYRPEGGRRPFRAPLKHTRIEGGADEHGPYIGVAFDLPRGTYATIVLRELMKNDDASDAMERDRDESSSS